MTTGPTDYRANPTSPSSTGPSSTRNPDPIGTGHSASVGTGNRPGTTGDLDKAKETARGTLDQASAEASKLGHDLKAQGDELMSSARGRAEEFAHEQKAFGADQVHGIASAANKAADELEQTSPQLARYVRDAASAADDFSESMRTRKIGDILQDVTDYARREPVVFFGITVAAGFALSRFLKSTADRSSFDSHASAYRSGSGQPARHDTYSPRHGSTEMSSAGTAAPTPSMPVASTSSTPAEYPTGKTSTTDPLSSISSSDKPSTDALRPKSGGPYG